MSSVNKWVLAVAGTHGKTTTSSMLAWILEQSGHAPGFLIGGIPSDFSISARLTPSTHFVIEGDEYDTAFFDKRSKFVHYRPKTVVLNNIEFDHADIFANLAEIERQFRHLVRIIPRSGLIVSNAQDAVVKRVLTDDCWTPVEEFGSPTGWAAETPDGEGHFEVLWRGEPSAGSGWVLTGEHNRMNALAAIAAARHAGIEPRAALDALSSFKGVRRRMEVRGTERGVTVYDDFAHHPTAIRVTLEGLRAKVGSGGRILAVLEPRSNTMRVGRMKEALPASLAQADRSYLYAVRLGWDPAQLFHATGRQVEWSTSIDALVQAIAQEARAGDHIVVMSNGGFGGIHAKLLSALRLEGGAVILYLHGFNSTPGSHKARTLHGYMKARGLDSLFACPELPHRSRGSAARDRNDAGHGFCAGNDRCRQLARRLLRYVRRGKARLSGGSPPAGGIPSCRSRSIPRHAAESPYRRAL